MSTRKIPFVTDEYYHVYNRGVDKRNIFVDEEDLCRFLKSMELFNAVDPVGSIFELKYKKRALGGPTSKAAKGNKKSQVATKKSNKKLVEFICFCLNPNHFHFLIQQLADGGISEFMKRIGGYTYYFNNKHKRSGALFQGKFKAVHVDSNEYLLHLSTYINLNDRAHTLGGPTSKSSKLSFSSWNEYTNPQKQVFCKTDVILEQFNGYKKYVSFAESSLEDILLRKERDKELKKMMLE